jgi:hypothetical protein
MALASIDIDGGVVYLREHRAKKILRWLIDRIEMISTPLQVQLQFLGDFLCDV